MGAAHQLISASLAAVFCVGMWLSAHFFMEYRSSREAPVTLHRTLAGPL
jgi:hypothetical protein